MLGLDIEQDKSIPLSKRIQAETVKKFIPVIVSDMLSEGDESILSFCRLINNSTAYVINGPRPEPEQEVDSQLT